MLVALVALLALALVLVLARRLRTLTERVRPLVAMTDGGLPADGTPVPPFVAVTTDGTRIDESHLAGEDRLVAFVTTDCAACRDQVHALRNLPDGPQTPLVFVLGPEGERADMVAALAPHAVVVEEPARSAVAQSFAINEFPAVLVVGAGEVRTSGHGVAGVMSAFETVPQH